MTLIEKFLTIFLFIPFILFLFYIIFVVFPVALYTDAECLQQGYPKSYVTIGLERYCSNLEGSVTISVKKQ